MPQRPVSNDELAAVGRSFGLSPRADNPRLFDGPVDKIDAMKAVVNRMKAGETLDAVLGNKPTQPKAEDSEDTVLTQAVRGGAEALRDVGSSLWDMAMGGTVDASPPTGAPIENWTLAWLNGMATGTAEGMRDFRRGAVNSLLALPKSAVRSAYTLAGRPLANEPHVASALQYLDEKTAIPNSTMGRLGAVAPLVPVAFEYGIPKTALSLAGFGAGQTIGETAGQLAIPKGVMSPEKRAAAIELVGDIAGLGAGAVVPRVTNTKAARIAKEMVTAPVSERVLAASKETGSVNQAIAFAAPRARTALVEAAKAEEASASKLQAGLDKLYSKSVQQQVKDLQTLLGPEALNGDFRAFESDMSLARQYYNDVAKVIARYDAAGQQPPSEFVEAFDHLHDVILKDKTINMAAYDSAIESLTDAASQGAKAFNDAQRSIPAKTMDLVLTVGKDVFDGLRASAENAGGTLRPEKQPSWMVGVLRDVLDMDRKPLPVSEFGAMDVPTAIEAAGGDATVPSGVDVVRVSPQAAVSQPAMPPELAAEESVAVAPTQSDVAQAKGRRTPQQRAEERGGSALKLDASKLSEERAREITNKQTFFRNALELRQLLGEFYALPSSSGERGIWLYTRKPNGLTNAESLSRFQSDIFKVNKQVTKPEDVVKFVQLEGAMNDPSFRPYLRNLFKSLKKKS